MWGRNNSLKQAWKVQKLEVKLPSEKSFEPFSGILQALNTYNVNHVVLNPCTLPKFNSHSP